MAPERTNEPSPLSQVDKDVLWLFLNRMTFSEQLEARRISRELDYRVTEKWNSLKLKAFENLEAKFVSIPAGLLPGGKQIDAFDTISAVDRQTWEAFMGGPPKDFPKNEPGNGTWENCPACPVTHVAWEENKEQDYKAAEIQKFIQRYNAEAKKHPELLPPGKTECIYGAGTDDQRRYAYLGDPTGHDHRYMLGEGGIEVTDENVGDFIWYTLNSESEIKPLGTKKKNAYGLERPSVWVISESLASLDDYRPWGRAIRGGSWNAALCWTRSSERTRATPGKRSQFRGFSMTRICH